MRAFERQQFPVIRGEALLQTVYAVELSKSNRPSSPACLTKAPIRASFGSFDQCSSMSSQLRHP
jgi:hypothetical protein